MPTVTRRHLLAFGGICLLATASLAAEPIRVGSVLSLTGPAAFLGEPAQRTLQMAVDKINATGGINGSKVELTVYDDGSEAAKANAFTKRLLDNEKVDAIIGGSSTGSTMAMVPLIEKAGTPFISLAGAVVIIEPVKRWVFKTPHTDRMVAERVLADMKKRGFTRFGLLSDTSGFGQSGRKETQQVAERLGMTIVADETYGPKDTDTTTQLTKLKAAPGIQALFVFGFGQGTATVSRNAAQISFGQPVYQSHGSASEEFVQIAGAAAEGVRLPAAAFMVADTLPDTDPQKAPSRAYKKEFGDRFKAPIDAYGGNAHDAAALLFSAIRAAGSTDKEKVRAAIEQTKGLVGMNGVFNMSPTDHLGLTPASLRMLTVKGGKFVLAD